MPSGSSVPVPERTIAIMFSPQNSLLAFRRHLDHADRRRLAMPLPREGQSRLVAASAWSDRLTRGARLAGSRERATTAMPITHYRIILTKGS